MIFIPCNDLKVDQEIRFSRFKPFGKLRYCRVTRDAETGKSRGTGFVCFLSKEDAEKCLQQAPDASFFQKSEVLLHPILGDIDVTTSHLVEQD